MDDRGYVDDTVVDKQWASKYILGPLYEPEPSQESATRFRPLPTPPESSSPTRGYFNQAHHQKAIADNSDEEQPFLRRVLSRRSSVKSRPLPPSPPRPNARPLSGLERKRSVHTATPPPTRWNQGTILSRANSVSTPRPSADAMAALGDENRTRRRGASLAERFPGDRSHRPLEMLAHEHQAREVGDDHLPRRSGSLRERFPGDMSHRPLATLARAHRAADRAPHLHNHRRQQPSDTIDSLDISGPVPGATYHHGGPFDATLKERNTNKKYAPVEALKDSNIEALKATPPEFLRDALERHHPLQGTAMIPPGMRDMDGRSMHYEEGADLMREKDAPGGPYKRWDHVRYRDDDFKGKGEPDFSLDQASREKKPHGKQHAASQDASICYEMQPTASPHGQGYGDSSKHKAGGTQVRQRSVSNGAQLQPGVGDDAAGSSGLQRSNTTGKSLTQSLKRRFGSLRRKRVADESGY